MCTNVLGDPDKGGKGVRQWWKRYSGCALPSQFKDCNAVHCMIFEFDAEMTLVRFSHRYKAHVGTCGSGVLVLPSEFVSNKSFDVESAAFLSVSR